MRTALVTGHKGFVGRHMVPALERAGYDVVGVDIAAPRPWDARSYFRQTSTRFDLVVHLAAVVGGRATIEGSPLSVAVDLSIDAELFQWALRTRPGRIVYYSSSAAYPIALQSSVDFEDLRESDINLNDVRSPDLTYGWSKLTGEYQAQFVREAGVPVTVIRPFSGYGPDQDLDYPFPSFIARALRREDPFEVWGDGLQVRDFVHIDDVVNATLAAVDAEDDGPYNVGWGRPTSFLQLAQLVTEIAGYTPTIRTLSDKPVGVRYRVADPTKMKSLYVPRITLEEGIEEALVEVDRRTL